MESACIPLVIGITGHRSLRPEDRGRLKQQIESELDGLKQAYPRTPLILLSTLGEGADRLAAEVAEKTDGVGFIAVLPWPEGVCDEAWHRGGETGDFERLLAGAERRVCLPLRDGISPEDLRNSEEEKDRCFSEVGRYISMHSQILIAIWNGNESPDSHTWQVIRWHLEGTSAPFAAEQSHLDEPETGPLIHFPMQREGDPEPPQSTDRIERRPTHCAEGFEETAVAFDRFNADSLAEGAKLGDGLEEAREYVVPKGERAELHEFEKFILDRYALADQLSKAYQKQNYRFLLMILGLILLTVATFEVYAHKYPGSWGLLLGYPILLGAGYLLVRKARKQRIYNRYLDYRALAEAMRIHLFWKLAGLREAASDYYLRTFRSRLDWIRAALRAWTVQSGEHGGGSGDAEIGERAVERLKKVRGRWIEAQHKFFEEKGEQKHELARSILFGSKLLFIGSLAVAFIQIARLVFTDADGTDPMTHYLIVGMAMLGVLAGLCHEYIDKRLLEKEARSYKWMGSLYGTALKRLDAMLEEGKTDDARELIRELGCEALAENADWVIYHREHEPELKTH